MKAILLMTFGSPDKIDITSIERFYTEIRHGIRPSDEEIENLYNRYLKIGGCPLQKISNNVVDLVRNRIEEKYGDEYEVYFANKYSNPSIRDAVLDMEKKNIEKCLCIAMEPQYSLYSIGTYEEFIYSDTIRFFTVKSWYDDENLINYWCKKIQDCISKIDPKSRYKILFTAHSLPEFSQEYDSRYVDEVKDMMVRIISKLELDSSICINVWQSAPDNGMVWMKPDICDYIREDIDDIDEYIVVPIGFISDHIEILYDLDIECRDECNNKNSVYRRIDMPNADKLIISSLVDVIEKYKGSEYSFIVKDVKDTEDDELVMPDFVKRLIEKKGRENVKMPYFVKKMLEKRGKKIK